ncbi:MAG: protein kinase [Deltaproteobacteria bacterium]|nr:protein kinase [Deltaproteobacteria bacterium]
MSRVESGPVLSGPVFDLADDDAPPATRPLSSGETIDAAGRYRVLSTLGRGGMGEVVLAEDAVLGRQVAVKWARAGGAAAIGLLAEAETTALLEHAAVVPIYDAGERIDGTPFYVMRVVRGMSLADAIARSEEAAPGRLRLVRHVLDAARAVAFAHRLGVVHRDIKPANLLIGELGETQVADWGLAARLSDEQALARAVGTRGFCAPEVVAGGPGSTRADVYSLGASLGAVLGLDPRSVTAPQGVPGELLAIVQRACATEPAERYADAEALAADLDAFLDGRLVQAHDYTPLELAARFWRQFRGPIVAVGAAILVAAVATAVGFTSTVAQRDRAERAERQARSRLGRLHAEQAVLAVRQGARAEAEVLGVASLRAEESPAARGALLAFAASPAPQAAAALPFAPCERPIVGPQVGSWICTDGEALRAQLGNCEPVVIAGPVLGAAVAATAGVLYVGRGVETVAVHDLRSGAELRRLGVSGGEVLLANPAGLAIRNARHAAVVFRPDRVVQTLRCPAQGQSGAGISAVSVADAADRAVAVCAHPGSGAGVLLWDGAEARFVGAALPARGASAAALDRSGQTLVVAGLDGSMLAVDLAQGATRSLGGNLDLAADAPLERDALGEVDGLVVTGSGDAARVLLHGAHGGGAVRRLDDGALLARLPARGDVALRASSDEATLTGVALLGRQRQDYRLDGAARPLRLGGGAGISALVANGAEIWLGRGNGVAEKYDLRTGRRSATASLCPGPVKDLRLLPDRQRVATTCSRDPGVRLLRWDDLAPADAQPPGQPGRRAGGLRSGARWVLSNAQALLVDPAPGPDRAPAPLRVEGPGFLDGATCRGGRHAWFAGGRGQLWSLDDDEAGPKPRALAPAPAAMAVDCDDAGGALATPTALSTADRAGARLWQIATTGAKVQRLALDPSGALVVTAHLDGAVQLRRRSDGRLLARMDDHRARVAALAFGDPGDGSPTLVSASWDGTVRLWGLGPLQREAATLAVPWPIDPEAASAAVLRR